MVGEIFAGIGAFNAMLGAAKALRDMDNTASRNAAVIELQGQILAAQENYAALLAKVRELEENVALFEDWKSEKQRYELNEHGTMRILAYDLKAGVEPSERAHSICPDCYQNRKKSILQPERRVGGSEVLSCKVCGWDGYLSGFAGYDPAKRR